MTIKFNDKLKPFITLICEGYLAADRLIKVETDKNGKTIKICEKLKLTEILLRSSEE